jgi:hypothetical protein
MNKKMPMSVKEMAGLVVLIAALFIVLSKLYDDSLRNWAIGIIGFVIGRGHRA